MGKLRQVSSEKAARRLHELTRDDEVDEEERFTKEAAATPFNLCSERPRDIKTEALFRLQ